MDGLKRWMTAGLMTTGNIPCKAFSDVTMRFLFWRAGISPISEKIALRYFEKETEKVKRTLTKELTKLVKNGAILTLTVRQWSVQGELFLGITLHCSEKIPCIADNSMDFIYRLEEEATASYLEKTLLDTLKTVGLTLTSIRGLTTDDAPEMRTLGLRLKKASAPLPFYHHCCFAQLLNISVLHALKSDEAGGITTRNDASTVSDKPVGRKDNEQRPGTQQNRRSAKELIKKVRAVIRFSKKTSAQNDDPASPEHSEGSQNHLRLKLDIRSKWTSTLAMLRDFVASESELRRLYAQNSLEQTFPLSEEDVDSIKEMIRALDIAEEASTRLWNETTTMSIADGTMQVLLAKLDRESTDFSCRLRLILGLRLLEGRGVAPRLARYVTHLKEQTDLDIRLAEICESIMAGGYSKLRKNFMDSGDIAAEISAFRDMESEKQKKRAETVGDDPFWDFFGFEEPKELPPVQELMDKHVKFGPRCHILFEDLIGTMNMLKAVSAPVDQAPSLVLSAKRFCDEQQDYSKFSDFLLLRIFYDKSKPWKTFLDVKRMADLYNLLFDTEDYELCSECEHEWGTSA